MRTNSEIVDLIIYLYKEKGWSLSELSRKVDIPKSSLSRYFNKNRQFPLNKVPAFSDVLGVSSEYIYGIGSESEEEQSQIKSTSSTLRQITETSSKLVPERQLVVLDTAEKQLQEQNTIQEQPVQYDSDKVVPLYKQYEEDEYEEVFIYGEPSAGRGTWLSDESIESIMYPKPVPDHDIALRVRGNSMEPLFQDGEIVFVRKTKNVNNGQIIIIIVNNEAYIKKLYKKSHEVKLVSLNPDYDDIVLTEYDDVEVVGTVIM